MLEKACVAAFRAPVVRSIAIPIFPPVRSASSIVRVRCRAIFVPRLVSFFRLSVPVPLLVELLRTFARFVSRLESRDGFSADRPCADGAIVLPPLPHKVFSRTARVRFSLALGSAGRLPRVVDARVGGGSGERFGTFVALSFLLVRSDLVAAAHISARSARWAPETAMRVRFVSGYAASTSRFSPTLRETPVVLPADAVSLFAARFSRRLPQASRFYASIAL